MSCITTSQNRMGNSALSVPARFAFELPKTMGQHRPSRVSAFSLLLQTPAIKCLAPQFFVGNDFKKSTRACQQPGHLTCPRFRLIVILEAMENRLGNGAASSDKAGHINKSPLWWSSRLQ